MKKTLFLIVLLTAGLLSFSGVMAADEAGEGGKQAPNSEEIVAMCEAKYDAEKYADEDERNNLIDKCISDSSSQMAPKEEG